MEAHWKNTKLATRAQMLSKCQISCVIGGLAAVTLLALLISTFSVDMLIYDEGNVYSCPVDYLEDSVAKQFEIDHADDEGKAWQLDFISHQKYEDLFYDPLECRPFY